MAQRVNVKAMQAEIAMTEHHRRGRDKPSALSTLDFGIVCHWLRQCLGKTYVAYAASAEPVAPPFLAVTQH